MLVLAGGFGTRLKGTVRDVPKPLAPINGIPLLQLQLHHWIDQGQRSFIFLLHYQAELIIKFLDEQSKYFGDAINIDWIVEEQALGTGGSVANAIHKFALNGSVLISNADTWLDGGLQEVRKSDEAAIGVIPVKNIARYGSIILDDELYVSKFFEKKINSTIDAKGIINAGLYKLPTSLFLAGNGRAFSLEAEILPKIFSERLLRAVLLEGMFFDIGIPEDYYKFCDWYWINNKKW
jgi:NDP-sugar pyrophosphorylase family protein